MSVSLDLCGFIDDFYLRGDMVLSTQEKAADWACLSKYVIVPGKEGRWNQQKIDSLSLNKGFCKNILQSVHDSFFICICAAIENEPNRDDNSVRDSIYEINHGNGSDRSNATIGDILEHAGNWEFGTAAREFLESRQVGDFAVDFNEAVSSAIHTATGAIGDFLSSVGESVIEIDGE